MDIELDQAKEAQTRVTIDDIGPEEPQGSNSPIDITNINQRKTEGYKSYIYKQKKSELHA